MYHAASFWFDTFPSTDGTLNILICSVSDKDFAAWQDDSIQTIVKLCQKSNSEGSVIETSRRDMYKQNKYDKGCGKARQHFKWNVNITILGDCKVKYHQMQGYLC